MYKLVNHLIYHQKYHHVKPATGTNQKQPFLTKTIQTCEHKQMSQTFWGIGSYLLEGHVGVNLHKNKVLYCIGQLNIYNHKSVPCTCKGLDMHGFVTSYKLLNLHENAYTCITIYCVPGKTKCSGRC